MKKIFIIITLAMTFAWVVLEFSPDPIFSPHPHAAMSFEFKLESTGEVAQGLKINSMDEGVVKITPLSSTDWIVSVGKTKSSLVINGHNKESLLHAMNAEWESAFLVELSELRRLPENVRSRTNELSPELNQLLTNRRKNLARLIFLPMYSDHSFPGKCYYGSCRYQFGIKDHTLNLNVTSLTENAITAAYASESDELGSERIEMSEKAFIDDFMKISLRSSGLAVRISNVEKTSHSFKRDDFTHSSPITLSGSTGTDLKAQLIKETESIDLGKLIQDARNQKGSIQDLGNFHQTLKKILFTRLDAVTVLLKELKTSKPDDPFYISSVAALISVDSDTTQKGLRDLIDYQLSRNNYLEARSLIMGLGQSTTPSPDTVDYLIEKAYGTDSKKDISETAQLATGSMARATEDPTISARLLERPLRELEEFIQGHPSSLPISNVLEVIGNSGSPSAFKNLKVIYENNKDPQTQTAVLNALRYMPQKEAGKMLEERLTSADKLIREQAKQALALRCEQYPDLCR